MRAAMLRSLVVSLALLLASTLTAQDWPQWGRTSLHDGIAVGPGDRFDRIEAQVVIDPFAQQERDASGFDSILVHYPVPLVDGNDVYLLEKSGTFSTRQTSETQRWNVKNMRRTTAGLTKQWMFASDWMPAPSARPNGGPSWEPVFHPALSADAVWVPGAGGTMFKVRRTDGVQLARVNPFGNTINSTIYVAGPPAIDAGGNVFYNAMQLSASAPWTADPGGAWLVRIAANGTTSMVSFGTLVPSPAPDALCTTQFAQGLSDLPLPPSRNAVAPTARCGPQRPGLNVAPAIAADGTIYTISRAHLNDRYGFLVAVNANLTPKWAASLRERFNDGCNVGLPQNGAPGGCRADSITGVDPTDNLRGSGRIQDDSTSSPVVLPDGNVLYGAYTRYNYSQGHLMKFSAAGDFIGAYGFGWDVTPAVWSHDGTYSIVMKENRYNAGSYCRSDVCLPRNISAPNDPEGYFVTQLDSNLRVEWQYRNTESRECERFGDTIVCSPPVTSHGFEWCVNALAVDRFGVVYANSEDGNLYAISQGGGLRQRIFLDTALGAAYTPLAIGGDGKIYTQNNGTLFVITSNGRRRAAGKS